jgi:HD-GYP domain-containing protein (c-di-GMP phosphodiesterase class II)
MVKTKEKAVPFQEILSSWTIRKKMLLLFACVFVPALALALLEGMDERRDIIAKAEQQMMMVAESLAAQQEQITAATRQLLGTLAQLPEVQYRDIKACNVLFRRLNQQNLQYTNISLATPDGNMVASSLPFTPGSVNLSDRRHIREAIRTLDFSVGEYIMGRVSKVSSINFTHPVIDKNGKLVAIIIAGFNLNEYERYISRIQMPAGFAMSIADHQGIRLFRWPENAMATTGKPVPKDSIAQTRGKSQGIFRQRSDDGINRIYAFRTMGLREGAPPHLFMFVGINEEKVLHEANVRMMAQVVIVGITGLLAATIAWLFVSLVIVRPIRSLSLASQNVGRGQRGVRTGLPHHADEIGQLANSFDSMASLLDVKEKERDEAEQALRLVHAELEARVRERTVELSAANAVSENARNDLAATLENLRKSFSTTIQVLVSAVETRDPYTSGHQIRSADLARAIATEMGLPQDRIEGIRMAGSIHDIGKLSIPSDILSKPTKLSELEFSLIKEHSRKGYEMLKDVESPWPLAEIVYQHHERMDGSGYPRNLKGAEMLIEARILAVADVVEAMASHRPYRAGLGIDAALSEIEKNRGIFYDDAVADACLRLFREKGFKFKGLHYNQ